MNVYKSPPRTPSTVILVNILFLDPLCFPFASCIQVCFMKASMGILSSARNGVRHVEMLYGDLCVLLYISYFLLV